MKVFSIFSFEVSVLNGGNWIASYFQVPGMWRNHLLSRRSREVSSPGTSFHLPWERMCSVDYVRCQISIDFVDITIHCIVLKWTSLCSLDCVFYSSIALRLALGAGYMLSPRWSQKVLTLPLSNSLGVPCVTKCLLSFFMMTVPVLLCNY